MSQIEASKLTNEKINKYLANALSTKDIELKERLDKLQKFNNVNINDDDNNDLMPPSPPLTSLQSPPPPAFSQNLAINPPLPFLSNLDNNNGNNNPPFPTS